MVTPTAAALLERDRELATLQSAVVAAPRLVIVEGRWGTGKSVLLAAGHALALEAGARVLAARASEQERQSSLAVARQLFEPGQAPDARALFELTTELARERPLMLVIDDVHRADADSLRWLGYLLRRADGLPVTVLLSLRALVSAPPLLLDAVEGERPVVLELAPLSQSGAAGLLEQRLGMAPDLPVARTCHLLTRGNPSLLTALAGALERRGSGPVGADVDGLEALAPVALATVVRQRLARVGLDAAALARAVAILGPAAEWHDAGELAGLAPQALHAAADQLAEADILHAGETLDFVPPVIRGALYAGLPSGERAALHARAARVQEVGGAAVEQVARHLLDTRPAADPWAVGVLRRAAADAAARGEQDAAAGWLRRALAEPPPAAERPALLRALGTASTRAGDPDGLALLQAAAAAGARTAATELAGALVLDGRATDAADALRRAGVRHDPGPPRLGPDTFGPTGYAEAVADRLDEAERLARSALVAARAEGSRPAQATAHLALAEIAYRRGAVQAAVEDARAALAAGASLWGLGRPAAAAVLADALLDRGDPAGAAQAVAEGLEQEAVPTFGLLLLARGRLRLAEGRPREAVADLFACARRLEGWGAEDPALTPWRSTAAMAHLRLGENELALALSGEELELARAAGSPRARAVALRTAGLVRGGQAGLALLREAADLLAGSPARVEHARSLIALGAALRRAGQRCNAREPLRGGLDLAHRCGATAVAEHARTELLAAGGRPRRERLTGQEALTPSERRVADLAARALTNREIARTLYVTPKTVEVHLRNAYRKLGIDTRRELAVALVAAVEPQATSAAA